MFRFARIEPTGEVVNLAKGDLTWPSIDSRNEWIECDRTVAIGDVYNRVTKEFERPTNGD